MPIKLTADALRQIFPRAPKEVIEAFASKQDVLTKAGINATRNRLAFFFANIEHECGGFTIPNLTENINYTAARMAQVWPNRFKSAAVVQAKYGTGAGWQKKAFNDIYGRRMGNRPGTDDGSTYIGRGGPQWTGRDGYAALERQTGLPAVMSPSLASRLDMQPEICAAFWTWKNLNRFADANDFIGCVRAWNGGTNGLADRKALMAGNDPILKRLETVTTISSAMPEKAPVAPATKAAATGGAVMIASAATGVSAASQAGVSAIEILGWIGGLSLAAIAAFLIGYRIIKGHWPWTSISTGNQLPASSRRSLQNSEPSSEQVSAALLAVSSVASPATPLPVSSASSRPRKRSAKRSQKTRTQARKSSNSKSTVAKKSAPKRKSKSSA